jgi:hypothetical protein
MAFFLHHTYKILVQSSNRRVCTWFKFRHTYKYENVRAGFQIAPKNFMARELNATRTRMQFGLHIHMRNIEVPKNRDPVGRSLRPFRRHVKKFKLVLVRLSTSPRVLPFLMM